MEVRDQKLAIINLSSHFTAEEIELQEPISQKFKGASKNLSIVTTQ
jgi:hypothetical protein